MRDLSATAGTMPLAVTLEVRSTGGEGIVAFLHGGTLPHVGGQALATPGVALDGKVLSRCDLWTAVVPGHRDAEVAALVARELCLATGEPVSVVAGVHVEGATPAQIRTLTGECLAAARDVISRYHAEADS